MKTDVHNLGREVVGIMDLPDPIFNRAWNPALVHQVLTVFLGNRQVPYASTKGRGDVRGGGKKPWRQKGTGRARQGSIRSPLWRGGGVSHGPATEKNFSRRVNKKMRQIALFSLLSKKMREGEVVVVDSLKSENAKTRAMAEALSNLLGNKPNALLIASDGSKIIHRLVSNIPHVDAISARSLNVYDILKHKNLVLDREAILTLLKHYRAVNNSTI